MLPPPPTCISRIEASSTNLSDYPCRSSSQVSAGASVGDAASDEMQGMDSSAEESNEQDLGFEPSFTSQEDAASAHMQPSYHPSYFPPHCATTQPEQQQFRVRMTLTVSRTAAGIAPGLDIEDCGCCIFCLDKPRFGGRGTKRQKCAVKQAEACVPEQKVSARAFVALRVLSKAELDEIEFHASMPHPAPLTEAIARGPLPVVWAFRRKRRARTLPPAYVLLYHCEDRVPLDRTHLANSQRRFHRNNRQNATTATADTIEQVPAKVTYRIKESKPLLRTSLSMAPAFVNHRVIQNSVVASISPSQVNAVRQPQQLVPLDGGNCATYFHQPLSHRENRREESVPSLFNKLPPPGLAPALSQSHDAIDLADMPSSEELDVHTNGELDAMEFLRSWGVDGFTPSQYPWPEGHDMEQYASQMISYDSLQDGDRLKGSCRYSGGKRACGASSCDDGSVFERSTYQRVRGPSEFASSSQYPLNHQVVYSEDSGDQVWEHDESSQTVRREAPREDVLGPPQGKELAASTRATLEAMLESLKSRLPPDIFTRVQDLVEKVQTHRLSLTRSQFLERFEKIVAEA